MSATLPITAPTPTGTSTVTDPCRWFGTALILVGVCARALSPFSDLPHWDMDPLVVSSPSSGLGPAGLMALDVVIGVGAAMVLVATWLRREPVSRDAVGVVGCMIAAVAWHGWRSNVGTIDDQYLGAAWCGGLVAAVALAQACRDERVRLGVGACLLGVIAGLCLKGLVQLGVEHPAMVEEFRRNKEAIFAAHRWAADSPMARSFERRVMQAEPTAWFALANVFGSLAAAGAVALGALALECLRRNARSMAAWVGGAAGFCGLMGVLSGSKGSLVVLALGIGVTGLVLARKKCPKPPMLAAVVLACIAAPIGAVIARSAVGERIGELSLLFRGMYWAGAARMIADQPFVGVGPGGFQSAFMLYKPALCPEDVRSAHNLFIDWTATLGLAGFAASMLVVAWTVRAIVGAHDDRDRPAPEIGPLRPPLRLALGVGAACTVLTAWLEMHASSALDAGVRVMLLGGWALVAWVVIRAGRIGPIRPALALGSLTLIVQSQVEVTATWPTSAPLALALLGAAAPSEIAWGAPPPHRGERVAAALAPVLLVLASVALLVRGVMPALRWEHELGEAADLVAPLAELRGVPAQEQPAVLSAALRRQVPPDAASVEAARDELSRVRTTAAAESLERAWTHQPGDWRTGRELSRLLTALSMLRGADPGLAARATGVAERAASLPTRRSGAAVWAATVWQSIPAPDRMKADAWLLEARERDPYNPSLAYQLAQLAADTGRPDAARERAREALRLQDQARLDPVGRGLSDSQLARLRGWAGVP